jgi:hypothetical protein
MKLRAFGFVLLGLGAAARAHPPEPLATEGHHVFAQQKPAESRKAPTKRRAVRQVIVPMPERAPVGGEVFRPTPPMPPLATPSGPVQISNCDAGGCTDINGSRYNTGAGNTSINAQGRPCTSTGSTVTCF